MPNTRLLVNRRKFDQSRIDQVPLPALSDGEVLVKTGEFGFTANNVSYALSGDMIGYWKYFPVEGDEWGIVPVWGFAEVIESRCVSLPVGSKFWGFLPMASHVVMKPVTITSGNFVDGADHRLPLPEMYNRYQRTEGDPPELIAAADARSVLFPLCFTGYVLADYLQDNDFFGATQVIIGSASSKTALGTAHFISQLANRPVKLVGLTSANNLAFLRDVDLFDEAVGYDDVNLLPSTITTVFVDMSGNGTLLATLHRHFQDNITASIAVGATHWDAPRNREKLPGPAPSFFFAPGQVLKRESDWGPAEMMRRIEKANLAFLPKLQDMVQIEHHAGPELVMANYEAMVTGSIPPAKALILSF